MRTLRNALVVTLTLWIVAASQAAIVSYSAVLSGAAEDPPNVSPGTGEALVDIDVAAHTLRVQVTFSDLVGVTSMAHIHGPTAAPGSGNAGVATMLPNFTGFPVGVSSGFYDATFDTSLASTFNAAFVTANGGTAAGAEAALAASLAAGTAYLNVHTSVYGGGEIRGFLQPVPEPATMGLLLLAVALRRRG